MSLSRRGFLTFRQPPEPKIVAEISTSRCLPFRGPECGACRGMCPEGVTALRIVRNKPVIDVEACTGCGDCVRACPVYPSAISLIEILPETAVAAE